MSDFSGTPLPPPLCVSLNFPVEGGFTQGTSTNFMYTKTTSVKVTFSCLVICRMWDNDALALGLDMSSSYFDLWTTLA